MLPPYHQKELATEWWVGVQSLLRVGRFCKKLTDPYGRNSSVDENQIVNKTEKGPYAVSETKTVSGGLAETATRVGTEKKRKQEEKTLRWNKSNNYGCHTWRSETKTNQRRKG